MIFLKFAVNYLRVLMPGFLCKTLIKKMSLSGQNNGAFSQFVIKKVLLMLIG